MKSKAKLIEALKAIETAFNKKQSLTITRIRENGETEKLVHLGGEWQGIKKVIAIHEEEANKKREQKPLFRESEKDGSLLICLPYRAPKGDSSWYDTGWKFKDFSIKSVVRVKAGGGEWTF